MRLPCLALIVAASCSSWCHAIHTTSSSSSRAIDAAQPLPRTSIQSSKLAVPWVVLPHSMATFTGGTVSDHDCVGLLVSPTAALVAASCISKRPVINGSTGVAVSLTPGTSDVEAGDSIVTRTSTSHHWRLRDPVTITVHPQFQFQSIKEQDVSPYDVALVQWHDAIPESTVPVVLASDHAMADHQETLVFYTQDFTSTQTEIMVQRSRTMASCGSREFASRGDVACVELKGDCTERHGQKFGFLTRVGPGRIVVSGLVPHGTLRCSTNGSTDAKSAAVSFVGVSLLENARNFIDATLKNHQRIDKSTGSSSSPSPSSSSSSSSSPVSSIVSSSSSSSSSAGSSQDTTAPKKNDWSMVSGSGSGSGVDLGTNTGSGSGAAVTDFPPLPPPPPTPWRSGLADGKAYLSHNEELPTDPRNVTDGGFAVVIAPQFLLTRVSWIHGSGGGLQSIQFAHFQSQSIRIRRVVVDQFSNLDDKNNQLVVVELEQIVEPTFGSTGIRQLATTLPMRNVDWYSLQTSAFVETIFTATSADMDPSVLSVGNAYNALVDPSLCAAPSDGDALLCVQSSGLLATEPHLKQFLPFNASFLMANDLLVGLSLGASVVTADARVAQPYQPLGSSPRVKLFLDQATNGTIEWTDKQEYPVTPEDLGLGRVLLYGNSSASTVPTAENENEKDVVACGAVRIADRFYLTMASCLRGRDVAWAVYEEPRRGPEEKVLPLLPSPLTDDATTGLVEVDGNSSDLDGSSSQERDPDPDQPPSEPKEDDGEPRENDEERREPREPPTEPEQPEPEPPYKGARAVAAVVVHPIYSTSQSRAFDFAIIELGGESREHAAAGVNLWAEPLAAMARVVEHDLLRNGHTSDDKDRAAHDRPGVVVQPSECPQNHADSGSLLCVAALPPATSSSSPVGPPRCSGISPSIHGLFHVVSGLPVFVGFSMESHCGDGTHHKSRTYSQVSTVLNFINAVVDAPQWGAQSPRASAADAKLPGFGAPQPPPPPPRKPFVVGLRMTKDGQNFCGGSLIAPQFVLTAAHCVTDGLANWVSIGSLESAGLNTEPIAVDATRTRIHPQYKSPYKYSHDAAILELAVAAYQEPVPLDANRDFRDGHAATMYGYGAASATSGQLSAVMHARDVSLLSRATCTRTLPQIDDAVLCAVAANGLDACAGDSGSPLVVLDAATQRERLVGVVSAGYGCGVAGVPGLYTRVAQLQKFVDAYVVGRPVAEIDFVGEGHGGERDDDVDDHESGGASSPVAMPTGKPPTSSSPPSSTSPGTGTSTVAPPGTAVATSTPMVLPGAGSRGSSGSSQPKDLSELPLEERNSHVTGAPSSSSPSSATTPPATNSSSSFTAMLQKTALAGDQQLSVWTESAFLQFLVGDYASRLMPSALLRAIAAPRANAVTLFSSGDVRGLLHVLARHDNTPLNRRKDRFQSVAASSRSTAQAAAQCVP